MYNIQVTEIIGPDTLVVKYLDTPTCISLTYISEPMINADDVSKLKVLRLYNIMALPVA